MTVSYARGLPQLVIPLPSRRERCLFSMRPITNNVGDLIQQIRQEDHGIDRVVLTTTGITDPAGLCWLLSGKEGGREGGRRGKGILPGSQGDLMERAIPVGVICYRISSGFSWNDSEAGILTQAGFGFGLKDRWREDARGSTSEFLC